MKNFLHLFFGIVGLICAICAILVLSSQPTNGIQVIGLLSLAVFGLALTMIFGYLFIHHYRENKAIDMAAKEQAERDWYYHEQLCAEQLYGIGKKNFEHSV